MTALLAAFSLQDKIEQYGAYAGIAGIFGLGVLSLLYFAQAREVKRLREWAGRAPERAAELQDRVQADAQRRVAAPPAPAPRRHLPRGRRQRRPPASSRRPSIPPRRPPARPAATARRPARSRDPASRCASGWTGPPPRS